MPGIINLNCFDSVAYGTVLFCVLFHAKQRMAVLFFCKQIVLFYLVFVTSGRWFVGLLSCRRKANCCLVVASAW